MHLSKQSMHTNPSQLEIIILLADFRLFSLKIISCIHKYDIYTNQRPITLSMDSKFDVTVCTTIYITCAT